MNSNAVIASVLIKSEPAEEPLAGQQATNRPTNMANREKPVNSRSADQPKLVLNYSTRSQLITTLNDLSTILECNEPIPKDAEERTCKKIEESIGLLVKLSLPKSTPFADHSVPFEERISARLTVELPVTEQLKMVAHLMDNRIAVQFDGTPSALTVEAKRSLISKNKQIIVQLLNETADDNSEPRSKRQRGR